jgi:hypothetical protein
MNTFENVLTKYPSNAIGIRVNEGYKIFDFWLEKNWSLGDIKTSENIEIITHKVDQSTGKKYCSLTTDLKDFSDLFDEFERIATYNIEKDSKRELFEKKVDELKNLFLENSYADLLTLSLTIKNKQEVKTRVRKPKQTKTV